jgi:hypothetical protein
VVRKPLSCALEVGLPAGAEEAVGTDLGEAAGEDVLNKAVEEGADGEGEAPRLVGAGVGVADGDAVVRQALEALVGEGDAIDVAGEVTRAA